ncbi:hypothetical protein GTA08_BOTSDO12625 [Botryosphaeria dothidea]|uniref:Uncharacterized protein n=1 Tax=Botryosphaeria dothidea TaxID=55169 RepID=A0A8H4J2D1_9PEZI|nr:hypothetical protein GTA08_BOTSDO12625 [Botryosphaeria dothidea]
MGISNEALTTIGVPVTVISFAWMALVGEAVGPLVWRLWKARRVGQEEEQPVVQEVEPEWPRALRKEITAVREEREERMEETLEDLRELLLIASEAAVETLHFQQRTELPSSSDYMMARLA